MPSELNRVDYKEFVESLNLEEEQELKLLEHDKAQRSALQKARADVRVYTKNHRTFW